MEDVTLSVVEFWEDRSVFLSLIFKKTEERNMPPDKVEKAATYLKKEMEMLTSEYPEVKLWQSKKRTEQLQLVHNCFIPSRLTNRIIALSKLMPDNNVPIEIVEPKIQKTWFQKWWTGILED